MAFKNLSFEYSSGVGATVLSGSSAPWAITTGDVLRVSVGGTVEEYSFVTGDGASEITLASAINSQATLVNASNSSGFLRLTALSPGHGAELVVLGGSANNYLVFDKEVHYGKTYFGAPWSWAVVVLNTGKAVVETFTDVVDPTRELFGTAWLGESALEFERVVFTDNEVSSFTERFRVYEPGWEAEVNFTLEDEASLFTVNEAGVLEDFEQFQAYEVTWKTAVSDGVFTVATSPEPTETLSDGSFTACLFAGSTESEVENFAEVIPGERYATPSASGTDTVLLFGQTFEVTDDDVPDTMVTDVEKKGFRSKFLAALINRNSAIFHAFAQKQPIFPETVLYLYPLVPLADIDFTQVKFNGLAWTNPIFLDLETRVWFWQDQFPPTAEFIVR